MYVFRYVTIIATYRHSHRLYANFIKHVILIIFEYGTHQAFKLQNRDKILRQDFWDKIFIRQEYDPDIKRCHLGYEFQLHTLTIVLNY